MRKFDGYGLAKIGSWKKIGVLAIQKVAKLVILEKNSHGRPYRLCKIPQHAEGLLELRVTMGEMTQD